MYERRFIVRNGLLDDGGWDRPCSAVCKLEDQGQAAYRRPKEGQLGVSPGGQGQEPGAPIPMSEGRRDGCPSPSFVFFRALGRLDATTFVREGRLLF